MAILTRKEIFDADDLQIERVPVPEWGGEILIRGLSGRERDRYEASLWTIQGKQAKQKLDNVRARLVALSAVDEEGNRLFEPQDVQRLGLKSGAVLDRLFDVARRLSGLTEKDVEQLKADFADGPNGDSGSI